MWQDAKKLLHVHPEIGWYSLLAILVMGPMLLGGYILTLDMVFTPRLPAPTELSNTYLFQWLLHLLSLVIGGEIVQKLLIFAVLVVTGLGMHRMVIAKSKIARYFAGILYTVNPFTYERWMAGQYLFLIGYALLPFLVRSLATLYTAPSRKNAATAALWYTAIGLVSIHTFAIALLLGAVMFGVYMAATTPKGKYYRRMWQSAGIVAGGVLVLNSYWLVGIISGHSGISRTINAVGQADLKAFTTTPDPHGLFINVFTLYGFWLERLGRYAMPNHNIIIWLGGFGFILSLIILGLRERRKQKSLLAVSLAICALIGLVLAMGIHAPVTGPLTQWLITHVPLMKGLREPEKFGMLLALAYAYFAGHGLNYGFSKLSAEALVHKEVLNYGALMLPLLYTATMPFGFARQLKPVHYPASWYSLNQQLQESPPTGKVLFLPWHQYMSYDFSPRVIANPAPNFFDADIIAGTNAEFGGLNDPTPTPTSLFIENQVLTRTAQNDIGKTLASRDIEYVILARGYDFKNYEWLHRQKDLKLVVNETDLNVYKNEAYHAR